MKLKRVLTVLLTSVMLLTMSSSVFAADVKPMASGIGDTKEQALTLLPAEKYTLYISNINDQDWYAWKNNTGEVKYTGGFLNQNDVNHRVGLMIDYGNGRVTDLLYAQSQPFHSIHWQNFAIPNGATLYLVVEQVGEYKAGEGYQLVFLAH
ncbi:hypothetical protein J25TS5_14490 [Paenibacillus faecis]|uniref:hypothetical protein n=1 Tax=Paenibacillus faecis TaxID=862114 RepID=UPI001B1F718B|nr:hypothetical protein [Paenibacillus faecis]GIO84517.1 hypothetical protein J25TS5_14490 [Paenibacillus faecis]